MNGDDNKNVFSVTDIAVEQLRIIKKENNVSDTAGLRIGIQGGGCCGPSYMLAFDENHEETDTVITIDDIKIYIDAGSIEELNGSTLEFVDGPQGKGFRINNPNQKSCCDSGCDEGGCGSH